MKAIDVKHIYPRFNDSDVLKFIRTVLQESLRDLAETVYNDLSDELHDIIDSTDLDNLYYMIENAADEVYKAHMEAARNAFSES